ncbi:hypothetical protein [Paraburkholderia sp. RAU2J]|uniref:hypothetical protein n=1 Tax=Paraburkholderia sp. RAU2J TaxID=1938810 RepID=UPI000EB4213E|nr:hypothetical protein [Paraburkholderia sp. RAU2J]
MRDAVTESTRYAIRDFYNQPAIDLTGVPQSVQNSILDIFNQVPETPLPGRGLDEFISDTISSVLGDASSGMGSGLGAASTAIGVVSYANELALESTGKAFELGLEATGKALWRFAGGALRALGGVQEFQAGVELAVGGGLLGAVVGIPVGVQGLDQLITGVRTMAGQDAQSLEEQIAISALGPKGSQYAGIAEGLGGLLSGGLSSASAFGEIERFAAPNLAAEATAAMRVELSGATALSEVSSIVAPAEQAALQPAELPRIAFIRNVEADMTVGEFGFNIGRAASGEMSGLAPRDPLLFGSEWDQGTKAEEMVASLRSELAAGELGSEINSTRASSFEMSPAPGEEVYVKTWLDRVLQRGVDQTTASFQAGPAAMAQLVPPNTPFRAIPQYGGFVMEYGTKDWVQRQEILDTLLEGVPQSAQMVRGGAPDIQLRATFVELWGTEMKWDVTTARAAELKAARGVDYTFLKYTVDWALIGKILAGGAGK